jgi:tetratricopeptide (TPR) repeat protein
MNFNIFATMKSIAFCLAFLFLVHTAHSCMQMTGTKYNGERGVVNARPGVSMLRESLQTNRKPDGAKMEADLRGTTNFNDRSDYSIALMYLGRSQEAVELLQKLEKEKPGEYFIAANLGTAYELSGKNSEALRWIKEGIHRNANSHDGTEWLHVKILEAKLGQQADPDFFKKHSVLELQPEQIGDQVAVGSDKIPIRALRWAIEYQLGERLQFVKPPDAAVASLLFDYAAIEAATVTLESAKQVLQLALEYGYPPENVRSLLEVYDRRIFWRKIKGYGFVSLCGAAAIGVLYLLYRLRCFVFCSKDSKQRL